MLLCAPCRRGMLHAAVLPCPASKLGLQLVDSAQQGLWLKLDKQLNLRCGRVLLLDPRLHSMHPRAP